MGPRPVPGVPPLNLGCSSSRWHELCFGVRSAYNGDDGGYYRCGGAQCLSRPIEY
jgi:hypothetical protein